MGTWIRPMAIVALVLPLVACVTGGEATDSADEPAVAATPKTPDKPAAAPVTSDDPDTPMTDEDVDALLAVVDQVIREEGMADRLEEDRPLMSERDLNALVHVRSVINNFNDASQVCALLEGDVDSLSVVGDTVVANVRVVQLAMEDSVNDAALKLNLQRTPEQDALGIDLPECRAAH